MQGFESDAALDVPLVTEVLVDRRVIGCEILQVRHAPEARHGAPEIVLDDIDLHEHLVQVPAPLCVLAHEF